MLNAGVDGWKDLSGFANLKGLTKYIFRENSCNSCQKNQHQTSQIRICSAPSHYFKFLKYS